MCQHGDSGSGPAHDSWDVACRVTGVAERVTQQEQAEEHSFLDAVMQTRPMQYVHSYLAQKVVFFARRRSMHLCPRPLHMLSMHMRSGLPRHV